jgi:hypothetical protein
MNLGKGESRLQFLQARFKDKRTDPKPEWRELDRKLKQISEIIPDELMPFFIVAAVEQVIADDDTNTETIPKVGPYYLLQAHENLVPLLDPARSPTSLHLAGITTHRLKDHPDGESGFLDVPRPPFPDGGAGFADGDTSVPPPAPLTTPLIGRELMLVKFLNFLLEPPAYFPTSAFDGTYKAILSDENFYHAADAVLAHVSRGEPLPPFQAQALQKRFMNGVKNGEKSALCVNRALAVFMDRPDGEFFFPWPVVVDRDFQRARAIAPYITDVCFAFVSDNHLPPGAWKPEGFLQRISQVSDVNARGWEICNTKLRTALDNTVEMKAERGSIFGGPNVILTKLSKGEVFECKVLVRTPNGKMRYSVTKEEWGNGTTSGIEYVKMIGGNISDNVIYRYENLLQIKEPLSLPVLPALTCKVQTVASLDSNTSKPHSSQGPPDLQTATPLQEIQDEINRTKERIENVQWIPVMLPAHDTAIGQALMITFLACLLNSQLVNPIGQNDFTNFEIIKSWTAITWSAIGPSAVSAACTVFRDQVGLPREHAAGRVSLAKFGEAWTSFFNEFSNPESFIPHIFEALNASIRNVPAWAGLAFIALCRTAILLGANRDDAMIKVFAKKPGKSFNALLLKLEQIHQNISESKPKASDQETVVFNAAGEEGSQVESQRRRNLGSSTPPPYIKILRAGFGLTTGEARAKRIEQDIRTLSAGILGVTPVPQ